MWQEHLKPQAQALLAHSLRYGTDVYGEGVAEESSVVNLAGTRRAVLLVVPASRRTFPEQAREVVAVIQNALGRGARALNPTVQTIFLRNGNDRAMCQEIFREYFGELTPVTNYVLQPPCSGAAIAVEMWAIAGESVRIGRHSEEIVEVAHDGLRWLHLSVSDEVIGTANSETYLKTRSNFQRIKSILNGTGFEYGNVVRAWFYLGGITAPDGASTRYAEFNRARNEFYDAQRFSEQICGGVAEKPGYPASTGIGIAGEDVLINCLALQTDRCDVQLVPLENPEQTSAYLYAHEFAPHAPRFSRAMALIAGKFVTTWISGTASIRNSETTHFGEIVAQTEQTLDNIEGLIGGTNFAAHGVANAGAQLSDLARVRVYIKCIDDYAQCRRVCQRRLGDVPAVYVLADVCRPELLVEIEGVAFSEKR